MRGLRICIATAGVVQSGGHCLLIPQKKSRGISVGRLVDPLNHIDTMNLAARPPVMLGRRSERWRQDGRGKLQWSLVSHPLLVRFFVKGNASIRVPGLYDCPSPLANQSVYVRSFTNSTPPLGCEPILKSVSFGPTCCNNSPLRPHGGS